MNEINQLVLAGAPDATVLEALETRNSMTKENVTEEGIVVGDNVQDCVTKERRGSNVTELGCVTRGSDATTRKYVSCVRVKGRPILPPVMTEELR